jgi:hypothetical protein
VGLTVIDGWARGVSIGLNVRAVPLTATFPGHVWT